MKANAKVTVVTTDGDTYEGTHAESSMVGYTIKHKGGRLFFPWHAIAFIEYTTA